MRSGFGVYVPSYNKQNIRHASNINKHPWQHIARSPGGAQCFRETFFSLYCSFRFLVSVKV